MQCVMYWFMCVQLNDELSQQIREEKRKLQEALAGKERELGELQDVMHRGVRERVSCTRQDWNSI